ncbi:MAG: globin family protein [Candidatus Thiodiazotropha sp.]
MSPDEIKVVKESWAKILPLTDQVAELFYARLFDTYPEVKPYFKGDMQAQGSKLMNMIDMAVNSLDNLEPMLEAIRESGRRHVGYGVKQEDYDKVAEALLWTLEQGLGEFFTQEVKAAWIKTYATLASVMKAGAVSEEF